MINITVEQLSQLIEECSRENIIDWGMLSVNENQAIRLISSQILEQFSKYENQKDRELILLASLGNQILENFCLNLKFMSKINEIHGK